MSGQSKKLRETASQTAGPFVHIGLAPWAAGISKGPLALGGEIFGHDETGERITITGCVYDGTGAPVTEILIEVWQANAQGIYAHDGDAGWGRVVPDFDTGKFSFQTIKPGAVQTDQGAAAPCINLWLVARGINIGLLTRMYFSDEADANHNDAVYSSILPDPRKETVVANGENSVYRFDIHLQGDAETVFFDV